MTKTINIGADYPDLELTIRNKEDNVVIPITGYTSCQGRMRFETETTDHQVPRNVTVVDAANGRVDFRFLSTDFAAGDEDKGKLKFWIETQLPSRFLITNEKYYKVINPEDA